MFPKAALHTSLWGDDWDIVKRSGQEEQELVGLNRIFDTAMNAGLNFWMSDLSAYGKSEEILGSFLHEVPRESYYVSAELFPELMNVSSKSATDDDIGNIFAGSVRRLRTGFIDVVWIPNNPEILLEKLIPYAKTGHIGRIGLVCSQLDDVFKFWNIMRKEDLDAPAVCGNYNLFDRSAETSGLIEWCEYQGTKFFTSSSGFHRHKELFDKLFGFAVVKDIAEAHHLSVRELAIVWAVMKGAVPIIGAYTFEGGAYSLESIDFAVRIVGANLSADEIYVLEKFAEEVNKI